MKKLDQYHALQTQLEKLNKQHSNLEAEIKPQLDVRDKCVAMAAEINMPLPLLVSMLSDLTKVEKKPRKAHKPRDMKIYVHPQTGERIETKGGNHKQLKEWKAQHGADVVEGWRTAA